MRPLKIDMKALETYSRYASGVPHDFPPQYISVFDGFLNALRSKQCNEPWEKLISQCLGVVNLETKHGWDGVDNLEVYEYKPSSDKKSPCGSINDDSIAKIEKCERLPESGMIGWMVLAGIDKEKLTFDCIYKFPLHIYNAARRQNIAEKKESNKKKENQTRVTYSVRVRSSIKLCEDFGQEYYVWVRDPCTAPNASIGCTAPNASIGCTSAPTTVDGNGI
jgi:hypothetical protein